MSTSLNYRRMPGDLCRVVPDTRYFQPIAGQLILRDMRLRPNFINFDTLAVVIARVDVPDGGELRWVNMHDDKKIAVCLVQTKLLYVMDHNLGSE